MTRRSLALLVVLLAALASAETAAAAERCKLPRAATLVAASSYTRVYHAPVAGDEFDRPTYACNRRTGRRFKLDDPLTAELTVLPNVQLAGTHMAYERRSTSMDIWSYALYSLDLATGKKRFHGSWGEDNDELLWDFQLVKSGALAWSEITEDGEVGEIRLFGAGGRQLLDSGPPALAETFAVSDNRRRIYWTNGDEARTALLR